MYITGLKVNGPLNTIPICAGWTISKPDINRELVCFNSLHISKRVVHYNLNHGWVRVRVRDLLLIKCKTSSSQWCFRSGFVQVNQNLWTSFSDVPCWKSFSSLVQILCNCYCGCIWNSQTGQLEGGAHKLLVTKSLQHHGFGILHHGRGRKTHKDINIILSSLQKSPNFLKALGFKAMTWIVQISNVPTQHVGIWDVTLVKVGPTNPDTLIYTFSSFFKCLFSVKVKQKSNKLQSHLKLGCGVMQYSMLLWILKRHCQKQINKKCTFRATAACQYP